MTKPNYQTEYLSECAREVFPDTLVAASYYKPSVFQVNASINEVVVLLQIPDYMDGAPHEQTYNLLEMVKNHFLDTGSMTEHPLWQMEGYFASPGFRERCVPVSIGRIHGWSGHQMGKHKDLDRSIKRLVEAGYLKETDHYGVAAAWLKKSSRSFCAKTDILMKTIRVSAILDTAMAPDFVLDYVMYHEMLHAKFGLKKLYDQHDDEFVREEHRFENWVDAERWLTALTCRENGEDPRHIVETLRRRERQ